MATINGYTAERMKEIEDSAIVDGDVVGDDLILKRFDGGEINAGSVRGAPGVPGVQDVQDQLDALMALVDPVGVPKPYTGAAAPAGYGLCTAAVEYDGATYPTLAGLYGTGPECVNGASAVGKFRLPNFKGRTLVGLDAAVAAFDTLHKTGGSKNAVVVVHDHPANSNQVEHDHVIGDDGQHDHGVDGDDGDANRIVITKAGSSILMTTGVGQDVTYSSIDDAGQHGHGGSTGEATPAVNTDVENSGEDGTDKNLPPYRVVNWIMRLA